MPAILAVLLIAAVAVAIMEFRRAGRPEPSRSATPMAATTTPSPSAPPVAVIGANCSPPGSDGTTADGSTAYRSTLQTTGAAVWSLSRGVIPSPTVTTGPTDTPLPSEDESPVRVCM